jgi:hypothetical protein
MSYCAGIVTNGSRAPFTVRDVLQLSGTMLLPMRSLPQLLEGLLKLVF